MKRSHLLIPFLSLLLVSSAGLMQTASAAGAGSSASAATTRPALSATPYILHLPGIGGPLAIDRAMTRGLALANLSNLEVYDWTCHDPGLHALTAFDRNQQQADVVARKITAYRRAHPDTPIYITAHSGGTGVAVWALERLPADIRVDTVILMASALSPQYDLSRALEHVRGRIYAISSTHDNLVLGAGTKAFGTIDRVNSEAAGMVGFTEPAHPADPAQYAKLVAMPYQQDWTRYGNYGDHIGPMARNFAAQVLAPLLGGIPPEFTLPSTRPAYGR